MQDEKPQFEFRNLPLLMIFNKSFFLQVWVDTSGARKKMKLNPGSYQKLLAENTTIDEMTMHSIQTGISHYCDTSYQTMQVYATRVVFNIFCFNLLYFTDIDRTFPDNIRFSSTQDDLRPALLNVLIAYAKHNPRIGYCQVSYLIKQ